VWNDAPVGPVLPERAPSEGVRDGGLARLPFVLAQRARSEGARWTRAV